MQVVHGITSLPPNQADAATLARLLRGHWGIENGLHYIRDVTLGEDDCRVQCGAAPQVLAACRNVVVHLVGSPTGLNRAATIRHLAADPTRALKLLNSPTFKK